MRIFRLMNQNNRSVQRYPLTVTAGTLLRAPASNFDLCMHVLQIPGSTARCVVIFMLEVVCDSAPYIVSSCLIIVCSVQVGRSAPQQALPASPSQRPSAPAAFTVSTFIFCFRLCSALQLCLQNLQGRCLSLAHGLLRRDQPVNADTNFGCPGSSTSPRRSRGLQPGWPASHECASKPQTPASCLSFSLRPCLLMRLFWSALDEITPGSALQEASTEGVSTARFLEVRFKRCKQDSPHCVFLFCHLAWVTVSTVAIDAQLLIR